ncbi:aldolase/citrate lyase family protein [Acuticoccus sp. M5D2P5]|uniref:HpcH/HpaI aldolase family protein n=1 Tax=Acuticoccus kalidii TaxID=2910977 RepID=UPI001F23851B|nr:aldolase/citrate lyase family protein [Acuticoccus kalidii]MCF3932391.1 aldolase/citrate lyase family protein [Acuticoccus kalidii]
MIKNAVKHHWSEGQQALNAWLSIGNTFTAEIMAEQGYDSVTIDLQHGALDYMVALPMIQAMRASGVVPIVRVPWNEPGIIMKALDAGAYGIICPMVNSRTEAEALVSAMRYPPHGLRSYGPTRVAFAAGANYGAEANDEILAFAMIETAEAMANLTEIVTTPGLDAVYVGPSDLSIGITNGRLPAGLDREEAEIVAAIKTILDAAHKAGIKAAIHCASPEYAIRALEWGYDMVTVGSDARLLASAAQASVAKVRQRLGG